MKSDFKSLFLFRVGGVSRSADDALDNLSVRDGQPPLRLICGSWLLVSESKLSHHICLDWWNIAQYIAII